MTAVLHFAPVQLELTHVSHFLGGVCGSLLGEAVGQLRPIGPGYGASHPGVVCWLAGYVDRRARCRVLASVGDELFDFVVGGPAVREDADLHPDRSRLAVLGDLPVEQLPSCRVGVGPGLDHQCAGAIWAPHTLPFDGDVSLSNVLGHRAADEAHRVCWVVGQIRFGGAVASPYRGHGKDGREKVENNIRHHRQGVRCVNGLGKELEGSF
jgi:hypothetical protein